MTALLLVAAIAADSLTYALMPAGHEANPIVIAAGLWAVLARWVAVAVLIALARYRVLLLVGACAGFVGAAANMAVLL